MPSPRSRPSPRVGSPAARSARRPRRSGSPAAPRGSYLPIARALAGPVEARVAGVSASALVTDGGPDNLRRLEAHEAGLALVENNITPGGRGIFAIAPLYQELLHIVLREGVGVERADDLRGKRIGIGQARSGTDVVARIVLSRLDIGPGEATLRSLPHPDAAAAMDRAELDSRACSPASRRRS